MYKENKNEDGSALASMLIMIVIITVFIGVILSGLEIQNRFIQQDVNEVKARYAAEEGIATFLNQVSVSSIANDTAVIITSQDFDEIRVKASPYGGFLKLISTAKVQKSEKSIRVLVGTSQDKHFTNAIVLGDTTSDLLLTGSTLLKGNIMVGQIGLQTTDFKGVSYSGNLEGDLIQKKGSPLSSLLNLQSS